MRIGRAVGFVLGCLALAASTVRGQEEILAEIQKTSVQPTIDGLGNDPVWAAATAHSTDEFFGTETLDGPEDLSVTWKGLWDDENLYVLVEVTDDEIVTEDSCSWEDDSVEIYLDAQNLDVEDYRPGTDVPAYQLTALAGFDEDSICARVPYAEFAEGDTSWFTWGINSYDDAGDETTTVYPQGTDRSQSVITDAQHYSFEVAFPWTSLDETPANILARGSMGFGVGVNDDDDLGGRDTQPIWGTVATDLWMRSDTMPSVALSTEVVGGGTPGDFDADGDLDAADINALSAAVRTSSTDSKFDVNTDGTVSDADRTVWIETLKRTYFGDANLDGEFNSGDFVAVFTVGKYETGGQALWEEGDWSGDGLFNSSDFVGAFQAGGYELGPRPAVASIPEPASMSLLALGVFGGLLLRRRRR
jgi:hypothetical protein